MKKGIIGFVTGLFVLAVGFVLTVLVMSSVNHRTFAEEIKSWGQKNEEQTLPDEKENQEENKDVTPACVTVRGNNFELNI